MGPDLLAPELCLDIHPVMHRLRQEEPVYWSPQLNLWVLTRLEDISAVLRDPRFAAGSTPGRIDMMPEAERQQLRPLRDCVALWMGHTRKEDHLRIQQLLKSYFSPRMVEQVLRPKARALATQLLDAAWERGEMEIVNELGLPLSAGMIAEMLGTPTDDVKLLRWWSQNISVIFRARELKDYLQIQGAVLEMTDYLRRFIEERRRERREDLISVFLDAMEKGTIHSEEEIIANCILLLFAGHESTAGVVGNGMLRLLNNRDQMERLRREPELMPSAVEELLRFDTPIRSINRLATEDLELGGQRISAGQACCLVLAAGNRDPKFFPEPDRFDITRKSARHLTFGYGDSYCLGAPLSRMELQVCFGEVLSRMPNLEPRFDKPDWIPLPPLWCHLASLKVSF
jgi:cytochrome P450